VRLPVAVQEEAGDLAGVVDALRSGTVDAEGIVDRGVRRPVVEEAVPRGSAGVEVKADDLAAVVDAFGKGLLGARGIDDRGVGPAVIEKSVVLVRPEAVGSDDLARGVDAIGLGRAGQASRVVEGRVGVGWHETGSCVIASP
jgi:hypothetical protein